MLQDNFLPPRQRKHSFPILQSTCQFNLRFDHRNYRDCCTLQDTLIVCSCRSFPSPTSTLYPSWPTKSILIFLDADIFHISIHLDFILDSIRRRTSTTQTHIYFEGYIPSPSSKHVLLRQPAVASCRRRRTEHVGAPDPSSTLRYEEYMKYDVGSESLTISAGASSAVPREDSTAFASQLEGMFTVPHSRYHRHLEPVLAFRHAAVACRLGSTTIHDVIYHSPAANNINRGRPCHREPLQVRKGLRPRARTPRIDANGRTTCIPRAIRYVLLLRAPAATAHAPTPSLMRPQAAARDTTASAISAAMHATNTPPATCNPSTRPSATATVATPAKHQAGPPRLSR